MKTKFSIQPCLPFSAAAGLLILFVALAGCSEKPKTSATIDQTDRVSPSPTEECTRPEELPTSVHLWLT